MATNLPSCFFIQFLEQLLKFLANFSLLKYVTSQKSYGFLITEELIFGFQILDLKDHFSASLLDEFILFAVHWKKSSLWDCYWILIAQSPLIRGGGGGATLDFRVSRQLV